MTTTPRTLLLVTIWALVSATANAQVRDEIELTRQVIQTERQAIIADTMMFSDVEGQAFWPLYRSYRAELAGTGDRLVKMITDYAENYDNIDDDRAQAMVDQWLSIKEAELKTKKKYVKRFTKVISPKQLALFYQVENKLDTIIDLELAASIPIIH